MREWVSEVVSEGVKRANTVSVQEAVDCFVTQECGFYSMVISDLDENFPKVLPGSVS